MSKLLRIFGVKPKHRRVILLVLFFVSVLFVFTQENSLITISDHSLVTGTYRVTEVYDGDTIVVTMNGKPETIRLIGVDTPETHDPRKTVQCFGKAASNFTTTAVLGKAIRLETDPLSTNRDRYDRLLRYVFVNNSLINAEIIKQGYGFANTGFPFTRMNEFKKYQDIAEGNNIGLWNECTIYELDSGQLQTNSAN